MRHVRFGCLLVLALAAGCSRGPRLVLVTGTVKVDGQPAPGVQVGFWPGDGEPESRNRYGSATTGPDGRFELRSILDKGIEPGEYKVTFSRLVADGKVVTDPKKKTDKARESLDERVTDPGKTDVTARVGDDSHDFIFELSSKAK